MIGQCSLFAPSKDLPLRSRVTIAICELGDVAGMLKQYHYLHRTRVGRQLNYLISIDGVVDGVITYAYPMTSNPINGVPSDEVLEFARLYLYSNIEHMASCAIGKTIKRIREDWMKQFPDSKEPKLIVSWSDTTLHSGTVYKASNFKWLKKSKHSGLGHHRGKDKPRSPSHEDLKNEKDCWIYELKTKKG